MNQFRIGVDLGGTTIKVGLVDESFRIISSTSVKTNAGRPWQDIVSDIANCCYSVCRQGTVTIEDIIHVGIGAPGAVQPETGVILFANNLGFHQVPIKDALSKVLHKSVSVANDANVAAFGEALAGGAAGFQSAVTITIGTGLGGGIILNRKIYNGFNGAGGELGHMVILIGGEQCTCGRKGCWESYASATALIRQTKAVMENVAGTKLWSACNGNLNEVSARTPFIAAIQGDRAAIQIVNKYIGYLSCGITNIINILQPEIVLIGGGVSGEGEGLLKPLRERVFQECYASGDELPVPRIELALLGNTAGIIGAAFLN